MKGDGPRGTAAHRLQIGSGHLLSDSIIDRQGGAIFIVIVQWLHEGRLRRSVCSTSYTDSSGMCSLQENLKVNSRLQILITWSFHSWDILGVSCSVEMGFQFVLA